MIGIKQADRKIHTFADIQRRVTGGGGGGGAGGAGGRCGTSGWKQTKQNSPPSSSANQNLKRQQCFSNKLINKRLIQKKTVEIPNGAHSLMTKYQLRAEHK